MSTETTPTSDAPVIDAKKNASFLIDPIVWAKRENKFHKGNILELKPDPTLNVRYRAGTTYLGVTIERDTLDIPSMKQGIIDGEGIHEPIMVSVRPNGDKVPLRGNRRTYAGQELAVDPSTPPALVEALTKRTPMLLICGLTAEQEQKLINDQDQKPFLRSELIRQVFGLRKQGWSFEKIAFFLWEQLGRFTSGGPKKLAEIRDVTDPALKKEKIRTWLRGTLDNYLLWGYDLGDAVRKCILLSEMKLDGILPTTAEQPYFLTTKASVKRIADLRAAKKADGDKWNGMIFMPGSEFAKVAEQFHNQDYGVVTAQTSESKKAKMMDRKSVVTFLESAASQTVKTTIKKILGEEVPDYSDRDTVAALFEMKVMLIEQYLPNLKPEFKQLMSTLFINPDTTDFQNLLEENLDETQRSTEVLEKPPEAAPHPDAEHFKLT